MQRNFIVRGLESVIGSERPTHDRARQMPVTTDVSPSAFGDRVIGSVAA